MLFVHKANTMNYKTNKVLLIDDNPHILSTLPEQLDRHFQKTKSFESPDQALDELKKEPYDIVLLDINYAFDTDGEQEGLIWLRRIKKQDPDVIVVLMTGLEGVDSAIQGLQEGAEDFVIKPWHPEKLIVNLKLLLQLRMLEQKVEKHKRLLGKRRKTDSLNLEDIEKHVVEKAVCIYQGNLSHAAKQLGITRATLYAKIKKYNLTTAK